MQFRLRTKFKPTGDQPQAIEKLTKNLQTGVNHQVLLGVTGSGKTYTMACVIEKIKRPVLIVSHNKTLAAQLYQEFKEFFPENAVHYFVSYCDYYQPEAYIPQTDTYIEKDAKINQEIDRLRHASTQDLLTRKDIIIVASVSCIYNIGSPEIYQKVSLELREGQEIKRKEFLTHLTALQYQRNNIDFRPGTFRVRGDTAEIFAVTGKEIIKVEFSGNKIAGIIKQGANSKNFGISNFQFPISNFRLYPAHFWVTPQEKLNIAIENIKLELQESLNELKKQKKPLEARRLEQKTNYDLEMLKETGFCHGIENYSRHLEFRNPGDPPYTLLDYFAIRPNDKRIKTNQKRIFDRNSFPFGKYSSDYVVFIDESHVTIPQIGGMYNGDKARKETLIEYGFRLPSALDNRPLKFGEFEKKIDGVIYVSATPGQYEMSKIKEQRAKMLVEQLIRPTGLVEPSVEIRPTKNQVRNLLREIKKRIKKKERTLAITLTKRLAEALSEYLTEEGIKTQYLHSEIKTLKRPEILRDLRLGKYDVLVGINLLREGLDLPEVSLVAILDADKEGFLRNETTLLQTMGRASRHPEGHVILYADKITGSIKRAVKEAERRRKIQMLYNKIHKITPKPVKKEIREWAFGSEIKKIEAFEDFKKFKSLEELEKEMKTASKNLDFERAAGIRDLIKKTKKVDSL